jgi:cardiolipin synthase (CMP-forming)
MPVTNPTRDRGVWTLPNFISVMRLALIPVFLWLLLAQDRPAEAGVLLAGLGATDWIDGYVARHYDQASEVGKVLDPTADRILLLAAVVGLLLEGSLPIWLGVLVVAREIVISVAVVGLAILRAARIDVQWSGKAGTLALMFGLPAFLLAETWGHWVLWVAAWGFSLGGLALSYIAAFQYLPLARVALREGREQRSPR